MNSARRGFTLVEVLAASVMLALVMGAVAAVVAGTLGGAARVERALDSDLALAEAEEVMADDLAFISALPGRVSFSLAEGPGGDSVLVFWSAAGAKAAWGDVATPLHSVTYSVGSTGGGDRVLFRGERPLVKTDGAYYDDPLALIENVDYFSVEAFDGFEWHDEWPAGETGLTLPLLVRARAVLAEAGGSARSIYVETAPHVESPAEVRPSAAQGDEGDDEDGEERAEEDEGESAAEGEGEEAQ